MHQFEYAVKLTPAKEGGYVVTCRDLPEVITQGEDVQDALNQASDAMAEAFAMRIEDELDFPVPSAPKRREYKVSSLRKWWQRRHYMSPCRKQVSANPNWHENWK